jgi:ribonuclease HII
VRAGGEVPSLCRERALWAEGCRLVAGVDEVGRGAWAGPLTVGVAVVPEGRRILGVRDSKLLSEHERERVFDRLAGWCVAWAVGHASPEECDVLGMTEAQRLAAGRALRGLSCVPERILLDGRVDFVGDGRVEAVIRGDRTCLSIAAASVLAKVTRDRIMREEARHFPPYDFDRNKGYPSPAHLRALHAFGPSAIHRRSWAFMARLVWGRAAGPGRLDGDEGEDRQRA